MAETVEEALNDPQKVSLEELHNLILSMKEENSTLRKQVQDLEATKKKEEQGTVGMAGGSPVAHHLHLVDGRVIQGYEGIGTHYSETLEDGTERVTRVNAHYPVEEIHPTKAYA